MNKEIQQICQKINPQDILNKKFYPVWFFTNERIGKFLPKLSKQSGIQKVFSIGGGGDFAFSCLVFFSDIAAINTCDSRQLANITIDLKIGLIKTLSFEEILDLLQNFGSVSKELIYQRVRGEITPLSRVVLDFIISNREQQNFLKCVKKSGYWFGDSFWQAKYRKEYLPYLTSEKYPSLQKTIGKINIYSGDFNDNLQLFNDGFYNLIYVSNIFDSKKYCPQVNLSLRNIKDKLSKNGFLLVATQNRTKKIIRMIEGYGFKVFEKEVRRFNIIPSIFGHYCYSFLLFQKTE